MMTVSMAASHSCCSTTRTLPFVASLWSPISTVHFVAADRRSDSLVAGFGGVGSGSAAASVAMSHGPAGLQALENTPMRRELLNGRHWCRVDSRVAEVDRYMTSGVE